MKNLETEKKWFEFYKISPKIYAITILALTFIWSIVDISVFTRRVFPYYGHNYTVYGIFGWKSWILVILVWWLIGVITAALSNIILKILFAPIILQTEYLEIIARNTINKTNTTNVTLNSKSPSMLEQALVKHSNGVKTAKMSEDEIIKKLTTLKDLYDQGILSEETYEKCKKELLNSNTKPEAKTVQDGSK